MGFNMNAQQALEKLKEGRQIITLSFGKATTAQVADYAYMVVDSNNNARGFSKPEDAIKYMCGADTDTPIEKVFEVYFSS